jgi:hypothetical protein
MRFRASNNNFTGSTIPAEISSLVSLQQLWIADCGITGSIPPEIGQLIHLTDFFAYDNALTGSIPDLGQLRRLQKLYLHNNQLTGQFHASIGSLVGLREINLSENLLTGELPSTIGNLDLVTELSLANNTMRGNLPLGFDNLTSLIALDLQNNDFNGPLPDYSSWSGLELINLMNNFISGPIHSSLFELEEIQFVYFSNNKLTGEIPSNYGNAQNLVDLWLNGNFLTGAIPDVSTGDMVNITEILLQNNMFTGEIPASLCDARNSFEGFVTLHADCSPYSGDLIRNPCSCCTTCFIGAPVGDIPSAAPTHSIDKPSEEPSLLQDVLDEPTLFPTDKPTPAPSSTPTTLCPNGNSFTITLMNMGSNLTYDAIFEKAKSRWESIIKCDLSDAPGLPANSDWFSGYFSTTFNGPVDDVVIGYEFKEIDGVGRTLGFAAATYFREDTRSPVSGIMVFDQDDFDSKSDSK